MNSLFLVPNPQDAELLGGSYILRDDRLIVIESQDASDLVFTSRLLQQGLKQYAGISWEMTAASTVPKDQLGLFLSVSPDPSGNPQAYKLVINENGMIITAPGPFGIYYGVLTLLQILEQCGKTLPQVKITDHPDYAYRGILLDISRDKVPTMKTLYELIDLFASWKINQLQLYTEHTFAYRNHPEVWKEASPFTGEEILLLDAYCRERFIKLVPNQNGFGHMSRWLKHEGYSALAETPDGFKLFNQFPTEPQCLDPEDPASLALIASLFDELLPHFTSSRFNVNLDEAFELGEGKSHQLVAEKGKGRVFLDYLLKIHQEVKQRNKTMMFWGDMLTGHPELIAELPGDTIALEWGYEAGHPFESRCGVLAENKIPFYVCPGTSSWCSISGRFDNMVQNIANAAENGIKHGAIGFLNTDWGDHGHWQTLPISMPGFIYGAAVSWSLSANQKLDLA
jgi:hexosaminidase